MGTTTAISWTDHTFNPWWGCVRVSEGCRNCYAATFSARVGMPELWKSDARREFGDKHWNDPRRWDRAAEKAGVKARVFCASMCDVFEDHPVAERVRPRLWDVIRDTPNLIWQLLTKRPENCNRPGFLPACTTPNTWIGTTIEDMRVAHRADALRAVNIATRFISYEPALGPLDALDLTGISWVIYGGESGRGFRLHDQRWARAMRDHCRRLGIAFFYKQGNGLHPGSSPHLDGQLIQEFPR